MFPASTAFDSGPLDYSYDGHFEQRYHFPNNDVASYSYMNPPFEYPGRRLSTSAVRFSSADDPAEPPAETTIELGPASSIPMCNISSSSFADAIEPPRDTPPSTTGCSPGHHDLTVPELLSLLGRPERSLPRKPKAVKMHECEVCQKKFPRPSGLRTHMNTHNNVKPFPCEYHSCSRTFAVHSNARRHMRTHGVTPLSTRGVHQPYTVQFDTPVIPPTSPPDIQSRSTSRLEWVPPKTV